MEQVTNSFWDPVLCLPHEGGHVRPLPTGASKGPHPRAEGFGLPCSFQDNQLKNQELLSIVKVLPCLPTLRKLE